jgi:hypothetical protein
MPPQKKKKKSHLSCEGCSNRTLNDHIDHGMISSSAAAIQISCEPRQFFRACVFEGWTNYSLEQRCFRCDCNHYHKKKKKKKFICTKIIRWIILDYLELSNPSVGKLLPSWAPSSNVAVGIPFHVRTILTQFTPFDSYGLLDRYDWLPGRAFVKDSRRANYKK